MILDRLGKELIYFDGGTGTLLQERGLKPGELPETWSLERADDMIDIARQYYEAGSDIVLSNTFGANALKFHDSRHELDEIVKAAIENVRKGAKLGVKDGRETYVGLDIGPTGKLLKPMGDLDFEDAYQAFAEVARLGEEAGADLIHIETMSDTYEVKAAVLAAKENTSLPVFATMIFDDKGKLLTGGDVPSVVAMLEGLRVDALGINCGMGPEQMMPIQGPPHKNIGTSSEQAKPAEPEAAAKEKKRRKKRPRRKKSMSAATANINVHAARTDQQQTAGKHKKRHRRYFRKKKNNGKDNTEKK